jgi:signal transduction histidine kinase
VSVTVRRHDEGTVVVTIKDDGVGFDQATVTRGMGLDNLRARVSDCSGEISIESAPGVGTTVTATLHV